MHAFLNTCNSLILRKFSRLSFSQKCLKGVKVKCQRFKQSALRSTSESNGIITVCILEVGYQHFLELALPFWAAAAWLDAKNLSYSLRCSASSCFLNFFFTHVQRALVLCHAAAGILPPGGSSDINLFTKLGNDVWSQHRIKTFKWVISFSFSRSIYDRWQRIAPVNQYSGLMTITALFVCHRD